MGFKHPLDWHNPGWRFGRYGVEREGLRYRVSCGGDDGIIRPCGAVRFWRWITAARMAQELQLANARGYHHRLDPGGPPAPGAYDPQAPLVIDWTNCEAVFKP